VKEAGHFIGIPGIAAEAEDEQTLAPGAIGRDVESKQTFARCRRQLEPLGRPRRGPAAPT
jgi:hypothetical protein